MTSLSSIALSGIGAAQMLLDASANNIANANTPGYQRREVVQSAQAGGGVSTALAMSSAPGAALETDLVSQLQAKNAFLANLAVFKTSDKLAGALLDRKA